jgi:hypothetical protein
MGSSILLCNRPPTITVNKQFIMDHYEQLQAVVAFSKHESLIIFQFCEISCCSIEWFSEHESLIYIQFCEIWFWFKLQHSASTNQSYISSSVRYDFGSNYRSILRARITHLSPVLWDVILVQVVVAFSDHKSLIYIQFCSVRYDLGSCSILRSRISHIISSSVRYDFGSSCRSFSDHESVIYLQFCEIWFWFKLS